MKFFLSTVQAVFDAMRKFVPDASAVAARRGDES